MGAVDANEEILSLVETLVKTERRLEEITLGQVDCVVGRDGRPFQLGRAQEQLRYNEAAKQASILNALSAHIALLDFEGVIISVNEAWRRFAEANVHHAPGHGLGVNYLDVCDRARGACSSEGPQVAAGIRAVLEGLKTSYTIEYPCHSPTEQRWFELTVTPLADDHANGVVVMHLNITERKFAEEILRASEANMSAAQRIAHFGSWEKDLTDLEGASANSLRWSDEMFRIAGYEPGGCEVTTELFFRLVHPEDREPIRRAVASAIREHQAYSIVHRLIRPDGTTRVVREAGRIFFDEKTGAPLKIVATAHDITENRQAEALLQHKQAELQVILDTVPAMIFYKDRQHRLLRINAAAMRAHGWTTEDFVGKTDAELGLPHAEQYVRDEEEIAATGLPKRNIIEPVFTATGTRWFQTDKFPICDGAGSITGFIGLSMDITERKLAEEELERTRAQFAGLVNSMDGIVWEADATSFQFTFVSQRAQHILGFSSAEWLSTPDFWTRQIHPDDRREAVRYCVGCTGRKENHTFEYRMLAADGRSVWMRDIVTYVEEPGKPAMRRGIMLDITERKNAAAALKELSDRTERRERMLSTALASMSDFAQIYDCQGRFLFVNQPLLDLWGITLDAAVGKNFFELGYPGDLADRLARELQEVFQNRRSVTGETPYTDPTGRAGCYEYIFSPAFTADGEVDFVVGTTRDITERKDAENALRRNQKHLRGLIDGMGPAMFVGLLTTEGILIEVNQAPLAAAGLKMEDVLGKPFAETPWWSQSPAAQQQLREAIVRAARGEASRYDVRTHGANNAI
ncbi:MAG: Blue-light-activated protein, partial [Verrucomicrobiales bacterium]|nr:Blue-light-activated protein [Verrucomicrobiales bacterium]